MEVFNSHTHTCFSHDGIGTVDEICTNALRNKLIGFAVTDHCDCEYADNSEMNKNIKASFHAAKKAQADYKDKLIISKGIEIGETLFNKDFAKAVISSHNWDVILASVHAVRIKDNEMPFSVIDFSLKTDSFIDDYVTHYFYDLAETAECADYDILCHLTVVLRYIVYKYNRTIDLSKHSKIITDILKTVIKRNKALEINTSGFPDGYYMPDKDIIRLYYSLGGRRICIGSDSHTPVNIALGLNECADFLKHEGFSYLTYYVDRKPVEYML